MDSSGWMYKDSEDINSDHSPSGVDPFVAATDAEPINTQLLNLDNDMQFLESAMRKLEFQRPEKDAQQLQDLDTEDARGSITHAQRYEAPGHPNYGEDNMRLREIDKLSHGMTALILQLQEKGALSMEETNLLGNMHFTKQELWKLAKRSWILGEKLFQLYRRIEDSKGEDGYYTPGLTISVREDEQLRHEISGLKLALNMHIDSLESTRTRQFEILNTGNALLGGHDSF
ncbi:hypothetical protein N7520_007404 [Penicillium odoratum]|uniref:uncharacterized protein n=1 Tax=Penicillium odoratum TaxID=1167516 RepID=UPI002547806C|nr:uncharacterized protein N7520_007404 [Penicillium odoratum]KAJ5760248.1 hypothetical protein N7520_007404 [Penicillium odoratum]